MAKISTYPILSTPTLNDLLIGTDVEDFNKTKNFLISDIADFILADNYVPYLGADKNLNLGINSAIANSFIVNDGTSLQFLKADGTLDSTIYQPVGNYITQLSGEASGSGPGNATVTLNNNAVTGKVLTGFSLTGNVITASDSILTAFGKIQNQINTLVGGVQYQGTWNADTNTPFLESSVGEQGYYFVVSVDGNTNLNGITDWKLGDWAIFNGLTWDKVDNTDAVISVNGEIGAVILTTTNISEGSNLYYTDARSRGAISLTSTGNNGPSTYNGLIGQFNVPEYTLTGLGGVPLTREITINGFTQDLSTNRTYNVGTVTSITTSAPLTGGVITGTGTVGITQSGSASDGFLSSIDWNTFNNKQNTIIDPVTGTGTTLFLPMWSSPSNLVNSPLSFLSDAFNFQYNSTTGATVVFTNNGLTPYTYSIQMNNFGSPRSTIHNYTDGIIVETIAGVQVSRVFANGNTVFGVGVADNGHRLELEGSLLVSNISNATVNTDRFLVSDLGVIKYRTGSELLSDIGAAPAVTGGYVTLDTAQTITGLKTFATTIIAGNDVKLVEAGTASATFIKNISGNALTSQGSNGFGFNQSNNIYFSGSNKGGGVFAFNNTGNPTYTLPDASGTLALTSDLHNALTLGTANGLSLAGQVLSLVLASANTTGALSDTDFNIFSGKQDAGNFVTIDTDQTITAAKIFSQDLFVNGLRVGKGLNANSTIVGVNAGGSSTGGNNSFFGKDSGQFNTTGSSNSFFGIASGQFNTTGAGNSFFGRTSGLFNTTGGSNSFFGNNSGANNTTGAGNSFFGSQAGVFNTTGGSNSFFGLDSGRNNTTGASNSFFGRGSGLSNTTGASNSFFGFEAGRRLADNTDLTIANNSIFIGRNTKAALDSQTNQIVIGHESVGLGSNTSVLGNNSTVFGRWFGNLLIGDSTNTGEQLQVTGNMKLTGTLTNGTHTYTLPSSTGTLALTSDLTGFVTLDTAQTITGTKTFTNGISIGVSGINGYSISTDTGSEKSKFTFGTKAFIFNVNSIPSFTTLTYTMPSSTGTLALTSDLHAALTLGTANGLSLTGQILSLALASTSTTGALSSTDWNTFNNKEGAITAGTTLQYFRGDKTFQTLNTTAVPEGTNLYFTETRVRATPLTGLNLSAGGTVASTDNILQAFGKIQNQISAVATGVVYEGTWNASTNTPTLVSSTGTKGEYYVVSVDGSTNLNGITDWKVGDWAIFNGSTWDKVDNTDAVSSVNGYLGAVSLVTGDVLEGAGSLPSRPSQLYFTNARSRTAISFIAGSGAYNNSTGVITIPTNNNQITNGAGYITSSALNAYLPLTGGTLTGALNGTSAVFSGGVNLATVSGNVGIRVSSALYPFHVRTSSNGNVGFRNPTDFNASFTTGSVIGVFNDADNANQPLYLESSQLGLNLVSNANTLIGGNVGIGTTAPSEKFTVAGSARFTGQAINFSTGLRGVNIDITDESGLARIYAVSGTGIGGDLALGTVGLERLRITSAGNVGIGTTNPQALTHIFSSGAKNIPNLGTAGGHIIIQTGGVTATVLGVNVNGNFYIQPQRINNGGSTVHNTLLNPSGGNVGIGTTDPSGLQKTLNIDGGSLGASLALDGGDNFAVVFAGATPSDPTSMYSNTGFKFATATAKDATGFTEHMRITSAGNVGIGTTQPANKLVVRGASTNGSAGEGNVAQFEGPSGTNGFQVIVNDTSNASGVQTKNADAFLINPNGGNVGIGTTGFPWGTGFLGLDLGGSTASNISGVSRTRISSNIYFDGTNNKYKVSFGGVAYFQDAVNISHAWYTAPTGSSGANATLTERLRITSAGNVLIGTTTDTGARLFVNGGDIGIQQGHGLRLVAPNGIQFKVTVNNSGTLITTAI